MVTAAEPCALSYSDLGSRMTLLSQWFIALNQHTPPFLLDTHGIGFVRSPFGFRHILRPHASITVFGSHALIDVCTGITGLGMANRFTGVWLMKDIARVRFTCMHSSAILFVISTSERIVSSLWMCGTVSVKTAAQEIASTGERVFHLPRARGLLAFSLPTNAMRFQPMSASMLSKAAKSNLAAHSEGFAQPE